MRRSSSICPSATPTGSGSASAGLASPALVATSARVERLRRRLQEAAGRKMRLKDPEAKLSELEDSLCSKVEPAAALEMARLLRAWRRREA